MYDCRIKLPRRNKRKSQTSNVLGIKRKNISHYGAIFFFFFIPGKDITHKMYSLNEQIGHMCTTEALSRAAREDHWRRSMNRSVSVDAVDTGTRGHVRSCAWKQAEKNRKNSSQSDSKFSFHLRQYLRLGISLTSYSPFLQTNRHLISNNTGYH